MKKRTCWFHDVERIHYYNTVAVYRTLFCRAVKILAIVEIFRCKKCGKISAELKASNGETAEYDIDFIPKEEMNKARAVIVKQTDDAILIMQERNGVKV